jgi:hypothetical protein
MRFAKRRAPRTPAFRIDQSCRSHCFRALPAQPSLAEETAAAWRRPAHFSSEVARWPDFSRLPLAAGLIIPAHGGYAGILSEFLPQFAYTYAKTGLLLLLAEQA